MSDTAADLEALDRFVLEADDLTELESRVGRFNVFHALGVARAEVKHSNALAWLLDPAESHALGDLFLKPVVMDLLRHAGPTGRPLSPAELDGADLNRTLVHRERKHIDLTIHSPDPPLVIAIENKIDAKEHSNQLAKYAEVLRTDFADVPALRVFLTPDGDEPTEDDWVPYSYADLHAVLARTRRLHTGAIGGDVGVFIDHYLSLIGSELMDDKEIDALCQRIYRNHKRAIDLIVERANIGGGEIIAAVRAILEERPDIWHIFNVTGQRIDFIPASWLNALPPIGRKRDEPRAWVSVLIYAARGECRMLFQVERTTDAEARERLLARLADGNDFPKLKRTSRGTGQYNRLWNRLITKLDDEADPDFEAITSKAREALAAFERDTAGVDAALREVFNSGATA